MDNLAEAVYFHGLLGLSVGSFSQSWVVVGARSIFERDA